MQRIRCTAGVVAMLISVWTFGGPAMAEDIFPLPLNRALAMSRSDGTIDPSVRFYFGDTAHPAIVTHLGEYAANKKTSAVGRSDMEECTRAFQSALASLQKRAHELGANAVINVHSYYKKDDVSIDGDVPCHTGFLMAGIALRGEMVRLAGD